MELNSCHSCSPSWYRMTSTECTVPYKCVFNVQLLPFRTRPRITSCTHLYYIMYMCMSINITSCTCLHSILYMSVLHPVHVCIASCTCLYYIMYTCTCLQVLHPIHVHAYKDHILCTSQFLCYIMCTRLSYSPHVSRSNILILFHFNSQSPSNKRPRPQAVNGNSYLQKPSPLKTFFFKTTCDCKISNYPFVSLKYFILILILWLALMI